jgi:hypothetical protein
MGLGAVDDRAIVDICFVTTRWDGIITIVFAAWSVESWLIGHFRSDNQLLVDLLTSGSLFITYQLSYSYNDYHNH